MSSGTASQSPADIMRVPSSMKAKPRPNVMPMMTGRPTNRTMRSVVPVAPSSSQISPVTRAATATACGVTTAV